MNIEQSTEIEILKFLREGNTLIIKVNGDDRLAKALSFYIEHLENTYTHQAVGVTAIDGLKVLVYYTWNIGKLFNIYSNYSYLKKLSSIWRELKWLKVKADTMPPEKELRITYVESKHNLPTGI